MPESTRSVLAGKNQLSAVSWRRPQNGTSFLEVESWLLGFTQYCRISLMLCIQVHQSGLLTSFALWHEPDSYASMSGAFWGSGINDFWGPSIQLKWRQKWYEIMLSFQLWKHRRTFSLACLPLGFCELFWKFSNESTVLTGTKEGFVTEWYLVSRCTASHHSIHNPPSFSVTRFASLIHRRWSTRDKGRESPTAMNFVSLQFDEIRIVRRCEMRQLGSSSFLKSNARCTTCFLPGSPSIYASKTASLWLCCLHQLIKGKADICRISATPLVASWLWIQVKDGRCFPLIDTVNHS